MFERFTGAARRAVVSAQEYAREFDHDEISAGHLLLGVASDEEGVARRVLVQLDVTFDALAAAVRAGSASDAAALETLGIVLEEVRRRAELAFGPGALDRPRRQRRGLFGRRTRGGGGGGHVAFSAEAKQSLEGALREAVARHDASIGGEHLLLALLATRSGTTLRLLRQLGVDEDLDALRARVDRTLGRAA